MNPADTPNTSATRPGGRAGNASTALQAHWRTLDAGQLQQVWQEARAGVAAFRVVTRRFGSPIQAWVRGQAMHRDAHYPATDVVDIDSGSQYFYHAHRHGDREHGHLHLFWHARADGRRWRHRARRAPAGGASHLLAIGLDDRGVPLSLFTVNRWVTDGGWFNAAQTLRMVDRFQPGPVSGYTDVNRWLVSFLRLYRPAVATLLARRDGRLSRCHADDPLSDTKLEVLSRLEVDWLADLAHLEHLCAP